MREECRGARPFDCAPFGFAQGKQGKHGGLRPLLLGLAGINPLQSNS